MKELIGWVASLEDKAARCYADAAVRFGADAELSAFLRGFAEDETWHRQAMERALKFATEESLPPAAITSDSALKIKIDNMFRNIDRVLEEGTCSRADLMEHIVGVEYSEWNDIFLYIVNSLKERHRDFSGVASKIQDAVSGRTIPLRSSL